MSAQPWSEAHRRGALLYLGMRLKVEDLPITIAVADVDTEGGFRRAVVRWVDMFGDEKAVAAVRDAEDAIVTAQRSGSASHARPWFAYRNGVMLRSKRGVGRRFATEEAALEAGRSEVSR